MRWIDPGDPLSSRLEEAQASVPSRGQVRWDQVQWHTLPVGNLAISPRTGGWAIFDAVERHMLSTMDRVEDAASPRDLVEAVWRRGLVTIGGDSVHDPTHRDLAIAATRDYYTLVLLLNSGCNLVCSYCYLGHAAPTKARAMPLETARSAIRAALDQDWSSVLLDFGEIAVAEQALRQLLPWAQRQAGQKGKRLTAAVQTNGTTLGDELADFLAVNRVRVGLSLDGPRDIHDGARAFRNGEGSYGRAVEAIDRCQQRGISLHLICTVTTRSVCRPEDVLDEVRRHTPDSFLFKPVIAQGEASAAWDAEGISSTEFAGFMTRAVREADRAGVELLDQSGRKFLLRLLDDRGGWRDSCTSRSCGSGRSLHVVGAQGEVHACPRFVSEEPRPLLQIGRREGGDVKLPDLLPASLRTPPSTCDGCSWLGSCGGGCTLAGQGAERSVPLPDPQCTSYLDTHAALFDTIISSFVSGRHQGSAAFNGAQVRKVVV